VSVVFIFVIVTYNCLPYIYNLFFYSLNQNQTRPHSVSCQSWLAHLNFKPLVNQTFFNSLVNIFYTENNENIGHEIIKKYLKNTLKYLKKLLKYLALYNII